ncbi:hypothetical protein Tco_0039142 [Tanacetum coccineum]
MKNKKVQPNSPRTSPNFDSTCCDDCDTKGDFLAETKEEDEETDFEEKQQTEQTTRWKLYTDGASSGDGSGAGLMVQVAEAIMEEENSWMTPIIDYLVSGILPADKKLARKVPDKQRKDSTEIIQSCDVSNLLANIQVTKTRHDLSNGSMALHTMGH